MKTYLDAYNESSDTIQTYKELYEKNYCSITVALTETGSNGFSVQLVGRPSCLEQYKLYRMNIEFDINAFLEFIKSRKVLARFMNPTSFYEQLLCNSYNGKVQKEGLLLYKGYDEAAAVFLHPEKFADKTYKEMDDLLLKAEIYTEECLLNNSNSPKMDP